MKRFFVILFLIATNLSILHAQAIKPRMSSAEIQKLRSDISKKLGKYPLMFEEWASESERKIRLQRVAITPGQQRVHLYFNEPLGQLAMREELIAHWEQMVRDTLGAGFSGCKVQLYCYDTPVERLIPNYYRDKFARDVGRQQSQLKKPPLVQNLSRPLFGKGLSYRHIALWPSHGKYYDDEKKEWIWQRPPLFCAIEDLNSFEYTYRYLIPMLENAGATVISPRERDPNPREYLFDESRAKILNGDWNVAKDGFKEITVLKNENPFELGSHLISQNGGTVEYSLKVSKGEYAIYISYRADRTSSSSVQYKVKHSGGVTEYRVNQQIGDGWIYLGTHQFDGNSKVTVQSKGRATTDAVRLGGGMGSVERGGTPSGVPRWAEGARYYLQYSGVPASIYAEDSQEKNKPLDYWDDYKSRGNWTTWLQNEKGVPLDAAIALHTNAGINDTIFGTLTINHTGKFKEKYKNGSSKLAGRDLADIVLTQIVNDLRIKYTEQWTRRSMYDKGYREVLSPDLPAIIIELFSHQNMNDMRYALDPQFRFDASRAIYKGILRFIADRNNQPYVVQPLPPDSFTMELVADQLKLSWRPTDDELEPTAKADYYKIYTRLGDGGFNNGTVVRDTEIRLPVIKNGEVRSYKITALNEGGESFASEILSTCFIPGELRMALIINEYTKLSAPDTVVGGFNLRNFVPYQHDYGIVGVQKNFDRRSEFIDNDRPGWGASSLDFVVKGIRGNSFDYTVQYGEELVRDGYSYISTSLKGYNQHKKYDKIVRITKHPSLLTQ